MDWNQLNDDDIKKQMEEAQKMFREKNPEIDPKNRNRYGWLMLLPFIVVFGLQFCLLFMGFEFLFVWEASDFAGGTYMEFAAGLLETIGGTTFNLLASVAYAAAGSVLFFFWYRKKILPAREKKESAWKKNPLLLAVGAVCLVVGAQYVCSYLIGVLAVLFPGWLMTYQQMMGQMGLGTDSGAVTALTVLYAVLLGPVVEELAFRGVTLGYGRKAMPFWAANTAQAFLFASLHMNPLQGVYTFAVGLLLGYIAYRSDSLLLSIAVHMGFNLIGAVAPNIIVMGTNPISFFLLLLLGMVLTYVGIECVNRCGWGRKK